ncbi:hypothetical protein AAFN47_13050 [Hoeflea sp. CAU 1731]
MLRTTDFIFIGGMAAVAVFTFQTKFEAEKELEKVERLKAEIQLEENTIDLLEADWSLLNQPSRIQDLVEIYHDQLGLEITEANQIVRPQELPARVSDLPPAEVAEEEQTVESIVTGSVNR